MIEVRTLSKTFGAGASAFTALDGINVDINANEFFTLLGPSGCGKTTLLRSIAGFEHPTTGTLTLEGQDLLALPPYERPVNTVFQNYALFPHLTVAENVSFGLEMQDRPKAEITATVDEMLALVKMTEMADRLTSQISGGQQQRVALARALAPKPKVLLLDEPLSALDFKLRKEMQIELKRLQAETGITFVFVTHDQEEALTMSDRIAVMNAGRILQIGGPEDIYDHPANRFVADFIGESNFLDVSFASVDGTSAMVALPTGEQIAVQNHGDAKVGDTATIAIRPEHAALTAGPDALSGTLENIVYFGTDTHFYVTLEHGAEFVVRQQNSPIDKSKHSIGDKVNVTVGAGVAQLLAD